jgi:hypothetical protein
MHDMGLKSHPLGVLKPTLLAGSPTFRPNNTQTQMIRILLLGRTGNNMFQYALGRVLAEKHGVPLVLDASWFNEKGWKEVSHFLKCPIKATVRRHPSIPSRALRKITGKHYWEYRGVPVLREADGTQRFDPKFLDAPADCMLFGYFQSPLYFESMADEIRAELSELLRDATDIAPRMSEQIAAPGSVAVHVRRTDFLHHPAHQVCDADYYGNAMEKLRGLVPDAKFHIFSDDPEWCRAEFTRADQEVVHDMQNATNPLHDMYLMSLAPHHIIANSSYSWWSAWLGDSPGQHVIMPDRWFASGIDAPVAEKKWK